MFVCPAGHLAIRKARHGKKIGRNQNYTYYFDVGKCRSCPLNNGCYRPGAKTKSYSVTIKSDLHQEQMVFQETDRFKEKARHRYKIEAKNGELKNVHGYGRAIAYGIKVCGYMRACYFYRKSKEDPQIRGIDQGMKQ